ncbi:hypothetical protein H4R20_005078, partial [Coemansia guatemalensis]
MPTLLSLGKYNKALAKQPHERTIDHAVRYMQSRDSNGKQIGIDWATPEDTSLDPDVFEYQYDIDSIFLITKTLEHV